MPSYPPEAFETRSDPLHPQYGNVPKTNQRDIAPSMASSHNSKRNLHYTALGPHPPRTIQNAQNKSFQPIPHDFINESHASWPLSEQDNQPSFLDPEIRRVRQSRQRGKLSLSDTANLDNRRPQVITNNQITAPQKAHSTITPEMSLDRSFDMRPPPMREHFPPMSEDDIPDSGYCDLPSEHVIPGGPQDNNQVPHAPPPDIPATGRDSENWLPSSFLRKRKWSNGASGSSQCLRNNQGESSSYFFSGAHSDPANGFFSHSSNVVLQQPVMIDNSQRTYNQDDRPDGTLCWLENYIMQGAEFDSSDRVPPPRCHPNTRASIIEATINWVTDHQRERNMRWIRGAAGVGKSAIVQTVFESLPENLRGGSVFFSRPNGRDNPDEVFPSIAYQLAVRDLSYRSYLAELMLRDHRSLNKSMEDQFRLLFEEPFARQKLRGGQDTLVIAIDGLDECGGDPTYDDSGSARFRGRSPESAQRTIVELISSFVQQYPSVPFVWIIASRPERHLKATFYNQRIAPSFLEEDIPVDSTEACKDVERYLNSEFTRIREDHDDLITITPWPSSKDFSLITSKASGLFIFAEVVIRFIDHSNPIQQLKYALAAISKVSASVVKETPLSVLDAMYIEVVSRVPHDLLESAKKIIGSIVLLDRDKVLKTSGTLPLICNILGVSRDVALTALRHLHSVLLFPEGKKIESTRPRFYHASFRDFLEDESRSHEFSVKQYNMVDELFKGLMRVSGRQRLDDHLLPWPRIGNAQALVDMAKENKPFHFLHFHARIFSRTRPVSENLILPYLLNQDFAAKDCVNDLHGIVNMGEKQLEIHDRLGVTSHMPIDSLGITCDTVSQCNISKSSFKTILRLYFASLNESNSSSEDIESLRNVLCHWVATEPKRLVRVWGRERFKRLVLINFDLDGVVAFIGF
ncbi:hypothetical protein AGABI2DRAFT_115746 [Agaricus bisporus var. bisporus H97]|uniref:hypothetical protein n=1 Tax=Agaricus bisporus var. bisporus (strain H97 / ATCC MYA-4626 / FGSC 10389) TaxID=936046 RepID=UPI00029F7D70|nr:hypothetical protein AGABI2DRAFT_115746 [Agaricus bisporus var. bisporus H97]EKV50684.1 hypothetical protein AGABI2DRAFT_115746 [Agaricus bisporus var. bisporus H97]